MANYSLPHFGDIDPDDLEDYYDVEIEFEGKEVEISLKFERETIDISRLAIVRAVLEKIADFHNKNKANIEQDYKSDDGDTVRAYVEHHLEDIPKNELNGFIDFENKSLPPEFQLMKALHLVRIGFYPDQSDQFVVFDYSISSDLTDYLVVINTNDQGELDYMTMES